MTATIEAPQAAQRPVIPHVGIPGLRLVRSEVRKITTTNAWWLFGIASVAFLKRMSCVSLRPTTFASPQSITYVSPKRPTMMLAGFRSRWMTPFECA